MTDDSQRTLSLSHTHTHTHTHVASPTREEEEEEEGGETRTRGGDTLSLLYRHFMFLKYYLHYVK